MASMMELVEDSSPLVILPCALAMAVPAVLAAVVNLGCGKKRDSPRTGAAAKKDLKGKSSKVAAGASSKSAKSKRSTKSKSLSKKDKKKGASSKSVSSKKDKSSKKSSKVSC